MDISRKIKAGCVRVILKIISRLDIDFALKKNKQRYKTRIFLLFMKKRYKTRIFLLFMKNVSIQFRKTINIKT